MFRARERWADWLGVPVLLSFLFLAALEFGAAEWIDAQISESRFSVATRSPSDQLLLVDIDATSLAEIGVWPWPRRLHGQLVDAANRSGADSIAFDIDFGAHSNPADDELFAHALSRSAAAIYLASFAQPPHTGSDELLLSQPIEMLSRASWPALVNVRIEADGSVRQFPYGMEQGDMSLASMPSLLANRPQNKGQFGIDWAIDATQLPRVSYVDLLKGRVGDDLIAGRKLIVGATAIELHDLFKVPVHGLVSGSTIIALASETLFQNRELTAVPVPVPVAILLLFATLIATRWFALRHGLLSILLLSVATEAAAFWAHSAYGLSIATGVLHLALGAAAIGLAGAELGLRRILLWVARTELKNQETILSRVLEDGFDGVVLLDDTGNVIRANRHASALFGLHDIRTLEDLPENLRNFIETIKDDAATITDRPAGLVPPRVLEYSVSSVETTEISGEVAVDAGRQRHVICVAIRDVTDREEAAERLHFLAMNDSLTGLPNRRGLESHLSGLLPAIPGTDELVLVSFDLDRFKVVNDTLGHTVGDAVLREVGRRAQDAMGDAFIARLGGDEFFAVLSGGRSRSAVDALVEAIAAPMSIMGHTVSIGASVGIARYHAGMSVDDLLRHADLALYRAKAGDGIAVFEASMEEERIDRLKLEHDLLKALDGNELHVVFQPQVSLATGEVVGAEALLRWHHPERGPISPQIFIPVAEEMGLMKRIGAWVLEESCRLAAGWQRPLTVAVNVSPLQFAAGGLETDVRDALRASGLSPARLELEITESVFVHDNDRLRHTFDELLMLGVAFALDDFGTGYSSLGYLHRFPISKVKIDQSFTREIGRSQSTLAVLRAVRVLATGLNIRTTAEGIETADQANILRELNYDLGQGYLYSKPIAATEFEQQWARSTKAPTGHSTEAA